MPSKRSCGSTYVFHSFTITLFSKRAMPIWQIEAKVRVRCLNIDCNELHCRPHSLISRRLWFCGLFEIVIYLGAIKCWSKQQGSGFLGTF